MKQAFQVPTKTFSEPFQLEARLTMERVSSIFALIGNYGNVYGFLGFYWHSDFQGKAIVILCPVLHDNFFIECKETDDTAGESLAENIKSIGVKQVLRYLDSDPGVNMPMLLAWVDRFDRHDRIKGSREAIHRVLEDHTNNWYLYIESLYSDIDLEVRKTIFENLVLNSSMIGTERREKAIQQYNCNIPWAILMDPTSACNLDCIGCWAADYGNNLNMDLETLDSIIVQGKELGTFMYIFSGGEPLIRKNDIITLCKKHAECVFLTFTNSTLIDDTFADEMLYVKNLIPAISIEGFEEATDSRRGQGTYKRILKAMEILKRKNLPFGISCCYTRNNTGEIGSEAFIDDMIAKGAKFAWFFTYMPVGKDAALELMVTPQQREHMYHQIRSWRTTKPLFTIDFWNDGEYVKGCIAGGRNYLHINANGDIEPCAFIHYSDSSIRKKSLLDAFRSPLFMEYRKGQPFNNNHLRPCPLLDNKDCLTKMVEAADAKSTDMRQPEDVRDLSGKCAQAADNWESVADRLWNERN
ncbi:MAG: radical SAM protein [Spirochaetes bacterium]|nr:radical SAM protein [Spirochaetota bacterium]